jgi:hypothetical protein
MCYEIFYHIYGIGYLQEILLVVYVFGIFWLVRRPNVMIMLGGVLGICTLILIIVLLVGAFRHQVPLAGKSMLPRVNAYFALKSLCCLIAQVGSGYLVWASLYSFPKASKFSGSYMALFQEDENASDGSYLPPATDHDSSFDSLVPLEQYQPSPNSVLLSDSRDTQSM